MTDTTAGEDMIIQYEADLLLDNIATATQNRAFLRGDPAEDKVLTEAVLENGKQAISRAINKALAAQPSSGAQGEAVGWVSEWTGMLGGTSRQFHFDEETAVAHADWMHGRSYAVCEATPAQPDTGDVAALREALDVKIDLYPTLLEQAGTYIETLHQRHKVPTTKQGLCPDKYRQFASRLRNILAALSKPNAQGEGG